MKVNTEPAFFPSSETSRIEIAQKIQKGDIIFTKYTRNFQLSTALDATIVLLQKLAQFFFGKQERVGYDRMIHAAIVIGVNKETGAVLISEAMPTSGKNDLRVVDLFKQNDLALKKGSAYEYHIMRVQETGELSKLTQKAAAIAETLGTKASYLRPKETSDEKRKEKKHKFSFLRAFNGVFNRYWNGKERTQEHIKRMFKQLADEQLRKDGKLDIATGGSKPKKFFCSYFIGHSLQQAELNEKSDQLRELRGVKGGLAIAEQIADPKSRKEFIRKWANGMAVEHFERLKSFKLETNFDPKSIAPQDLMRFLAKRADFIVTLLPPAS